MNRRALGAALLLLTVLAAVVVPRINGTRLNGSPIATYVQPPPTVGECVTDDPNTSKVVVGQLVVASYGPCAGSHFGEVVQVFADYRKFPRARIDQILSPDSTVCTPAATSYLGADQVVIRNDRGDYRSMTFGPWTPVSVGDVDVIGPTAQQRAIGQTWVACVTEGGGTTPFTQSVRGAFMGGALPDSYGVCTDKLLAGSPVSCSRPHQVELFATTGMLESLPSSAELNSSCTEFVQYLTGRTDVASTGKLTDKASPIYYGVTGHPKPGQLDPIQTSPAEAFCGVTTTGSNRLTGTLFGIRDRPLPLS